MDSREREKRSRERLISALKYDALKPREDRIVPDPIDPTTVQEVLTDAEIFDLIRNPNWEQPERVTPNGTDLQEYFACLFFITVDSNFLSPGFGSEELHALWGRNMFQDREEFHQKGEEMNKQILDSGSYFHGSQDANTGSVFSDFKTMRTRYFHRVLYMEERDWVIQNINPDKSRDDAVQAIRELVEKWWI